MSVGQGSGKAELAMYKMHPDKLLSLQLQTMQSAHPYSYLYSYIQAIATLSHHRSMAINSCVVKSPDYHERIGTGGHKIHKTLFTKKTHEYDNLSLSWSQQTLQKLLFAIAK